MEQTKKDRISELTRISRERELTAEECAEREALRREYLDEWRRGADAVLGNTYVEYESGNIKKLKKSEE